MHQNKTLQKGKFKFWERVQPPPQTPSIVGSETSPHIYCLVAFGHSTPPNAHPTSLDMATSPPALGGMWTVCSPHSPVASDSIVFVIVIVSF